MQFFTKKLGVEAVALPAQCPSLIDWDLKDVTHVGQQTKSLQYNVGVPFDDFDDASAIPHTEGQPGLNMWQWYSLMICGVF